VEIRIFDVEHGFCSMIATDTGMLAVIDCGHSGDRFRPSSFLRNIGWNRIHHLVISNFDHDHVSDLHNVLAQATVCVLHKNQSLSPDYLRRMKLQNGPLTNGLEAAINLASAFGGPLVNPPDMAGLQITSFANRFPDFTDTNNLSLATFVKFENFTILYSGDLEEDGWEALLRDPVFCTYLSQVNIFVASHHGRIGGYCREVFNHCTPDAIVISDKNIVHDTQRHNSYDNHATGLVWPGNVRRRVLTTRCDGTILIEKPRGQNYTVKLGQ
jgi:beta-lactamase superfamily II metal-dependent hydrolase